MGNKLTGQGLTDFVKMKIGTPYVYGAKGSYGKFTQGQLDTLAKGYPNVFTQNYVSKAKKLVGKVCTDCSGLISWYTGKTLGSAQMYSTAKDRSVLNKNNLSKVPKGAVLWRTGHVGVYIGGGELIEAKGIDWGTVKSKVQASTFTHYLLFKELAYDTPNGITVKQAEMDKGTSMGTTKKEKNPYNEPAAVVKRGMSGESVKWVQFELRESGYVEVVIDGKFGPITEAALKMFQQSCKITTDGCVGPITKKNFKGGI